MRNNTTLHTRVLVTAAALGLSTLVGLSVPAAAAPPPPPLGYTPVEFVPPGTPAAPPAPAASAAPATPAAPGTPADPATPGASGAPTELGPGATGQQVLELEQHLAHLRYFVGPVDGRYDADTTSAVMAFQKERDMSRTGRATTDVISAVRANTAPPPPMVPDGDPSRVEIDLNRQILHLYNGGGLVAVLPVSSGSGERFCSGGWCRNAVTRTGTFSVYRQGRGWETGPLGSLYNPQYFDGGIAIHGSKSVPAHPASHGCVRIPMSAAEWFPDHTPPGTKVYVLGG